MEDAMSNRLSGAMNKMSLDASRNSIGLGRPPPSPGAKRLSGLDPAEINSMFPDAAAAIAKQKADFTQQTGAAPQSNRNSAIGDRSSLLTPTISAPSDELRKDAFNIISPSPWGRSNDANPIARPKSSSGQQTMGFGQTSLAVGGRSPRMMNESTLTSNTLHSPDLSGSLAPMLSPYTGSGNWASMVNTPMNNNFPSQQTANQVDMVANATAMKLAALSTVNNRIQLDDARKYRRARSSDGQSPGLPTTSMNSSNIPSNFIMTNELGQILNPQQAAALQAQQLAAIGGHRSRPTSPGGALPGNGTNGMSFGLQQNNGYLAAYDSNASHLHGSIVGLGNSHYGIGLGGSEGYLSDASDINRGRSPRGRRGSSRPPPEDPTDIELLKDIPNWLRGLRLHKYTDNLKDMDWRDLIMLDDAGLERKGVNALGARRKMTKRPLLCQRGISPVLGFTCLEAVAEPLAPLLLKEQVKHTTVLCPLLLCALFLLSTGIWHASRHVLEDTIIASRVPVPVAFLSRYHS
ncbi:hypothetical protein MRB53_039395 [Persea americana]|nr:hypothetical protein MRB53_039395 [Persea americana]